MSLPASLSCCSSLPRNNTCTASLFIRSFCKTLPFFFFFRNIYCFLASIYLNLGLSACLTSHLLSPYCFITLRGTCNLALSTQHPVCLTSASLLNSLTNSLILVIAFIIAFLHTWFFFYAVVCYFRSDFLFSYPHVCFFLYHLVDMQFSSPFWIFSLQHRTPLTSQHYEILLFISVSAALSQRFPHHPSNSWAWKKKLGVGRHPSHERGGDRWDGVSFLPFLVWVLVVVAATPQRQIPPPLPPPPSSPPP